MSPQNISDSSIPDGPQGGVSTRAEDWKRRYELVAAASGQVIYEYDTASGEIFWGHASIFVLGQDLGETARDVGKWYELMHPDDRETVRCQFEESLRSGAPFESEYRLRHVNGDYLWFKDRAYFSVDETGRRSLFGLITDITPTRVAEEALRRAHAELEQRVMERTQELAVANLNLRKEIEEREVVQGQLAASEEKYRAMVNALPQVLFETDLEGRIRRLNRQGYEATGLTPEDLERGVSFFKFVHPDDRDRLVRNWKNFMDGRRSDDPQYVFIRGDGALMPVTSYVDLIRRDGVVTGVTGFLVDETPRRRAQELLQQAHDELERNVQVRTAQLEESNKSLLNLLKRQEMNIELAHKVLQLVNSAPTRHLSLREPCSLFVAAQLLPRQIEGGDHSFVRALPGSIHISLKDESGHDVGCILRSIITDLMHHALLTRCDPDLELGELVSRLNAEICRSNLFREGDFFTAVELRLERSTLRLHYVLAAHPPFMLVRAGRVFRIPEENQPGSNLPLGMLANHSFQAGTVQLEPGDKLILFTDGLIEAGSEAKKGALSSSDLPAVLQELIDRDGDAKVSFLAGRLFQELTGKTIEESRASRSFPDDVGLVVAEIESPVCNAEFSFAARDLEELKKRRMDVMNEVLSRWSLRGLKVSETRLQLVLEEALLNAWRHGNGSSPDKLIHVRLFEGNDARIDIIDEGPGFDTGLIADPTAYENRMKPSGRGLYMIRRFTDEAIWSSGGRHLSIYFSDERAFAPRDREGPTTQFRLWSHFRNPNSAT